LASAADSFLDCSRAFGLHEDDGVVVYDVGVDQVAKLVKLAVVDHLEQVPNHCLVLLQVHGLPFLLTAIP
jgi:hypothetical protein